MRFATPLLALLFAAGAQAQAGYLTYSTGINPTSVTAADLNGDGKPDLVISNTGSDSLTILLNNGAHGRAVSSSSLVHFQAGLAYAALGDRSLSEHHWNEAARIDVQGRWAGLLDPGWLPSQQQE